jgi:hypothetical protein
LLIPLVEFPLSNLKFLLCLTLLHFLHK